MCRSKGGGGVTYERWGKFDALLPLCSSVKDMRNRKTDRRYGIVQTGFRLGLVGPEYLWRPSDHELRHPVAPAEPSTDERRRSHQLTRFMFSYPSLETASKASRLDESRQSVRMAPRPG